MHPPSLVDSCNHTLLAHSLPDAPTDILLDIFTEPAPLIDTLLSNQPATDHGTAFFSATTLFTVTNGIYPYTADLTLINAYQSPYTTHPHIADMHTITTPLRVPAWAAALANHPDQAYKNYVLNGISSGFRIGFNYAIALQSATRNMPSAEANPSPVQDYLSQEVAANRVIGPLHMDQSLHVHISRFGVIPKRHQPGKWRLILDLSHPLGSSVNDGISRDLCSLQFASVDDAAGIVLAKGAGARLAKIDIAKAYRNVPVHPSDRPLLGMQWQNQLFIDKSLPFGLRSAPKIFCALSDALEWILRQRGISSCVHYIDDFLTVGAGASEECQHNLGLITTLCEELGVPLASDKVEGPLTTITFLGIEIDTKRMELRLPQAKLDRLKDLIATWVERKAGKKRDILSLIGQLAHACKVVTPGRTFLRRLIDLASSRSNLDHWIRIDRPFKSDLFWWHIFLDKWNGTSLLYTHTDTPADIDLFTDASGSWGCGAVWSPHWFQAPWSSAWLEVNIATKELVPIVLAAAIWGRQWAHKHVRVWSDNMAVVHVLHSRTSKDSVIMHLLRCLHFFTAQYDIKLKASHIVGVANVQADALSRNYLQVFKETNPEADKQATPISEMLWEVVVSHQPDWLSQDWRRRLRSMWRMA